MTERRERVVELDLGVRPDPGTPMPLLAQGSSDLVLVFRAQTGPGGEAKAGVVEASMCLVSQFGYPNDEALSGHPLWGHGLGFYGIHEVLDSSRVARFEAQNHVAFPGLTPPPKRHFIITFHDETFECLADDLTARIASGSPKEEFTRLVSDIE
jgi:hypothetical protein